MAYHVDVDISLLLKKLEEDANSFLLSLSNPITIPEQVNEHNISSGKYNYILGLINYLKDLEEKQLEKLDEDF